VYVSDACRTLATILTNRNEVYDESRGTNSGNVSLFSLNTILSTSPKHCTSVYI
jgi:hypothetical protein